MTCRNNEGNLSSHDHCMRQLMTFAMFTGEKQTIWGIIILSPQKTDYQQLMWLLNFKILPVNVTLAHKV